MEEFSLKRAYNGVWYGTFAHFDKIGIKHAVSSRIGGISKPPFATLNLGLHMDDQVSDVIINRQRFCQAVGVNASSVVTVEQVHGNRVLAITNCDIGKGAQNYQEAIRGTDALISNIPGIPLLLFFADCVPVLIADPVHKAVGISHAGWKGTVSCIAQKTVLAMQETFGTEPSDCLVGIGPSIGPCCYEVEDGVIHQFQKQFSDWSQLLTLQGNRWHLNLWQANVRQLEEIGVVSANIISSTICTACNNELFFSYRAENAHTGRIGALITL